MGLLKSLSLFGAGLVVFLLATVIYLLGFGPDLNDAELPALAEYEEPTGEGIEFRFLGNSNIWLSDGVTNILIDGFFTRPSTWDIATGKIAPDIEAIDDAMNRAAIDELAAVITVHSHFDHAMDSPEVAARTGAVLLGSESTANIGRGWNLDESKIRVAEFGSRHVFGGFTVSMLKSKHFEFPEIELGDDPIIHEPLVPPVEALAYKEGGAYSVLIEHPRSGRWLIQGSAGFIPGALDDVDADVLLLGIGGLASQTSLYQSDYWKHVVEATEPNLIIPIHFDAITDTNLGDELALANNLWSRVLGFTPLESIAVVNALASEGCIPIAYPTLWSGLTLGRAASVNSGCASH